jgi:hypothetical protein
MCPSCSNGEGKLDFQVEPSPEPEAHIPTGWACPRCNLVHAPHVTTCQRCAPDHFDF